MSQSITEKFAPYPKAEEGCTADAIYRHLLVQTQVTYLTQVAPFHKPGGPNDKREHVRGVEAFISEWTSVFLWRKLLNIPYTDGTLMPETADGVALDLWYSWDDGSDMAPALWEWLEQAGFDPAEIEAAIDTNTP